jgi:zinc protease
MMNKISSLVAVFLLTGGASGSPAAPAAPHEYRLDNGMKVIVKEDHRAPVVISQVWYRVGSADEHSGLTGVSHVLEHMMFKGTERYPAGRFSEIIAENGGQENAFTARDYTAYYQLLEASRLPIGFELEADRMANLVLSQEAFVKERNVVKEERRLRTEDNPTALAYEQLYATAFDNSPYHNPVIGWMGDLDSLQLADLRRWYRQWYAPDNATLVVVGDVDPDAVYRAARRYFGGVDAHPLPEVKPRPDPRQRGLRRALVKAPTELPYIVMGYKTPVLGRTERDWEPYALEVLAGVLDGGRSARLSRELIREQEVAASAGAGYGLYGRHSGLFLMDGIPAADHSMAELERALQREVERLQKTLVEPDELQRVKAQVLAGEVYRRDSVSSQANQIGMVETIGLGWRVLDEYVPRIEAVTAEQVRQVARKYLTDDLKTVVVVEPLSREAHGKPRGAPPATELR